MRIAVCPGSFDPVTNGHIDIFERTSALFDQVVVGVFHNPNKQAVFGMDERVAMLVESTRHIENIRIDAFSGLLNEYVKAQRANVIIRGLRAISDFEDEFSRALMMKRIDPAIETMFMMTCNEYSFLSSSGVRELAKFGGSVKGLVPSCVEEKIKEKYMNKVHT